MRIAVFAQQHYAAIAERHLAVGRRAAEIRGHDAVRSFSRKRVPSIGLPL
jgi:hypothetical protein